MVECKQLRVAMSVCVCMTSRIQCYAAIVYQCPQGQMSKFGYRRNHKPLIYKTMYILRSQWCVKPGGMIEMSGISDSMSKGCDNHHLCIASVCGYYI